MLMRRVDIAAFMMDTDQLIVFNAGSSSLKFELFVGDSPLRSRLRGSIDSIGRPGTRLRLDDIGVDETITVGGHGHAAEYLLECLTRGLGDVSLDDGQVVASGHRIVHGGEHFSAAVAITPAVIRELEALSELAPLHNPPALAVLSAVRRRLKGVPAVAAFDTAFFADLPEGVSTYAIPEAWRRNYGIRRYGFHGIAHAYLYGCYEMIAGRAAARRVVSLHLGQGCSVTALRDGRPIETSMGFTPLEGLVMGTRSGDLDPGVVLHLARQGRSWQSIDAALNHDSGLLGLSGVSDDMRELLQLEADGHAGAHLAVAVFCHRIHKYLGAYTSLLGGLDALLFGGGIGENSAVVRGRICKALEWLGLEIDEQANKRCSGAEAKISTPTSPIRVQVIPVREEEAIAGATMACLAKV